MAAQSRKIQSKKRLRGNVRMQQIPSGIQRARHYWAILKRHFAYYSLFDKRSFWQGIVAGIARAPLNVASIFVTGLFVDSVVSYYTNQGSWNFVWFLVPIPVAYLIILFLLSRAVRVLDALYTIALTRLRNDSIVQSRRDVAEKFHKLNSQEVDKEEVKDLLTKFDTFWVANAANFYSRIAAVGEFLVSIVMSFIALYSISPVISLLVILVPLPEILSIFRNNRKHAKYVNDVAPLMLERNYYFSSLTDPRSFSERKINGVFRALIARYQHTAELVAGGYKKVLIAGEKEIVVANIFDNILLVILKVFALMMGIVNKMVIGSIIAMLGYIDSLYRNAFELQRNLIAMFDELTFVEYLYEFQDTKGFADDRIKGKHLKKGIPKITLDKATFSYNDGRKKILDAVDLEIHPGEKVMILGKDGTGKSSLLSVLAGLYELDSGEIRMNTTPLPKLARGQIKIKMSVVPEDFARYYMTLKENVILGDPRKEFNASLYNKALEITGLGKWAKENAIDEDNTILGNFFEGSVAISSGHWQRIAIARAIYRNRDVFLLDQPFTYIDGQSIEEILPKLMKFIGKRTLIWISEQTHHEALMDSVYELKEYKLHKKKKK